MIYRILRILAGLAFVIYFRKIYLIDARHLPKEGPVLLACNHPSAFMEACVLSCFLPRHLHYLTRGDFFTSGIARWFLRATHQIPIYRTRDGFKNLRNNRDTFEECYARLSDGKVILMFPEAMTVLEKRLRPIQRGAARIGLGAIDRSSEIRPVIVPVGVTFTDPRKLGGDAYFKFAAPIDLSAYRDTYQSEPQDAIREVTRELEAAMRPLIIDMKDVQREHLYDALAGVIETSPATFPVISDARDAFEVQQEFAQILNGKSRSEIEAATEILARLERHGPRWRSAARERLGTTAAYSPWLLIYAIGSMINLPVSLFMRWFIRSRVHIETFKGPMNAVIGYLAQGLYYVVLIVALYVWKDLHGLLLGMLLTMIGYFSIANSHLSEHWKWLRWRVTSIKKKQQIGQEVKSLFDLLQID